MLEYRHLARLRPQLAASAAVALASVAAAGAQSSSLPLPLPTFPAGFTATLFTEGLATPRHIAVRDNGDVYVTLRSGASQDPPTDEPGGIVALRDTNGDGVADISRRFGTPDIDTGLALHDGHLYYASTTTIYAVALGGELVPSAAPEIIVGGLPESGSGHRTKPITFDGAGHLFTQVGSPSNACQADAGTPGSPGPNPCTLLEAHGGVLRFSRHGAQPKSRARCRALLDGAPQRRRARVERGRRRALRAHARARRAQSALARALLGR